MAKLGVTVHIFRHGEKSGDALTQKGINQALAAGRELRSQISDRDIVKMFSSPALRTQQTRAFITEGLGRGVYHPRTRATIGLPKMDKEKWDAAVKGVGEKALIESWVDGTLVGEAAEAAEGVANRLRRQALGLGRRIAERSNAARLVHLVYVTHQGGIDRLVSQLTGKKLSELGGLSRELEHLSIHIPESGPGWAEYRGQRYELPRESLHVPKRAKRA